MHVDKHREYWSRCKLNTNLVPGKNSDKYIAVECNTLTDRIQNPGPKGFTPLPCPAGIIQAVVTAPSDIIILYHLSATRGASVIFMEQLDLAIMKHLSWHFALRMLRVVVSQQLDTTPIEYRRKNWLYPSSFGYRNGPKVRSNRTHKISQVPLQSPGMDCSGLQTITF